MCGINGFNFLDRGLVEKMNSASKHRGPDASGVFTEEGVSLGHNRLKIIDLSENASQPMKSFDEAEVIVFNGEIYNFKELKQGLRDSYPFKSESDTEVIIAVYRKWGAECVKKFNGIFAFAIWDRRKRELFLARDHAGVKPLYYYLSGDKFIFSSEIKSILEHNIPRRLNHEAFNHYMRVLYVPEPLTMFENIYKFPQASRGVYKNGELTIEKYWSPKQGNYLDIPKAQLEKELRNQVQQAASSQLVSDKPLGLYLSGGLDSSIILYHMAHERSKIDTFSVGFALKNEEQKEKFNADFNLARSTAQFFGTNHSEVLIKPDEVWDLFEKAVWQMDEPISNATAVAMLKLSGFAKQKADVVLTGDGGDELFGGYDRYRMSLAASIFQKLPYFLRRPLDSFPRLGKLNIPAGIDRFALFMFQKNDVLEKIISPNYFNSKISKKFFEKRYFSDSSKSAKPEEVLMNVDRQTWLPDFALMLTDKMSMANGLEARVPFLDRNLVEFASLLPLHQKISPFCTKTLLKKSYRGLLPAELLRQPKRGWFSPGSKWLRTPEVREKAKQVLSEEFYPETAGLFNWPEIGRIFEAHISGKEYHFNAIWALLTFQIWARRFNIHI